MPRVRLRFGIRRMMVVIAMAGIVLALAKYVFIDNRPRDLLIAAISALGGHYTVYAEGYSESKFRSLRVGMTARQVEDIMGPPLTKGHWQYQSGSGPTTPGVGILEDMWYYTRGGKQVRQGTASHWKRTVLFRNGLVYETDITYYLD
jgi:hypothetical protein